VLIQVHHQAPVLKVLHAPWTSPIGCGITIFIQYPSTVCNVPSRAQDL
jgi:hypothetical protein